MAGYFDELAPTREMLDSRYDDLKTARWSQWTQKNSLKTSAVKTNYLISILINDGETGFCHSPARGAGHPGNLGIAAQT